MVRLGLISPQFRPLKLKIGTFGAIQACVTPAVTRQGETHRL
jgi:hypothetical protein